MKKLLLLILFGVLSHIAYAPKNKCMYIARGVVIEPYGTISKTIALVESSNNPLAYNKTEKAVGLYQIRPIRLRDYNEKTGSNYELKDMFDPVINKKVFLYYATKYRYNDYESIARDWNGKYGHTDKYWRIVKSKLPRKENKH
jgi:hypothetical protein